MYTLRLYALTHIINIVQLINGVAVKLFGLSFALVCDTMGRTLLLSHLNPIKVSLIEILLLLFMSLQM